MKIHPYAEMIPSMTAEEYQALKNDIKEFGQKEPIIVSGNQILDGRHRYRACKELKLDPICIPYSGTQAEDQFVLTANLHRRHLSVSQRAVVALAFYELAVEKFRRDKKLGLRNGKDYVKQGNTRTIVAKDFNLQEKLIGMAKTVKLRKPELIKEIATGKMAVTTAYKIVREAEGNPMPFKKTIRVASPAEKLLPPETIQGMKIPHVFDSWEEIWTFDDKMHKLGWHLTLQTTPKGFSARYAKVEDLSSTIIITCSTRQHAIIAAAREALKL